MRVILTEDIPFSRMARRHSEEDFSALRGGRVTDPRSGERNLFVEALGPSWQTTLAGLEAGEISEPTEVELLDGQRAYHIVKLEERIPSHRVDITQDYALIEQYALRDKQNRVLSEWLERLREDVFIDIRGKAQESMAQN